MRLKKRTATSKSCCCRFFEDKQPDRRGKADFSTRIISSDASAVSGGNRPRAGLRRSGCRECPPRPAQARAGNKGILPSGLRWGVWMEPVLFDPLGTLGLRLADPAAVRAEARHKTKTTHCATAGRCKVWPGDKSPPVRAQGSCATVGSRSQALADRIAANSTTRCAAVHSRRGRRRTISQLTEAHGGVMCVAISLPPEA